MRTKFKFLALVIAMLAALLPVQSAAAAPIASLSGGNTVGDVIAVNLLGAPQNATLTYAWKLDGTPILGASGSSYIPVGADAGHLLAAVATFKMPGYPGIPVTSDSILIKAVVHGVQPTPLISGDNTVGAVLVADPGAWDVGASFAYAWFLDGDAIVGATDSSYLIADGDAGRSLTVQVTGSWADGSAAISMVSAPVVVQAADNGGGGNGGGGGGNGGGGVIHGSQPTPSISGDNTVGAVLVADPGAWDDGATFAYAWFLDGDPIVGATDSSYLIADGDAGRSLSVQVTGSWADGSDPISMVSAPVVVQAADNGGGGNGGGGGGGNGGGGVIHGSQPTPSISGDNTVGAVLVADPGAWDDGATFAYAWFLDDEPITGATDSSYLIAEGDAGRSLTVQVTGSWADGSDPISMVSAPVVVQAVDNGGGGNGGGDTGTPPTPVIYGDGTVGSVIAVDPGTWDNYEFTYQWYSCGLPIADAIGDSYTITESDAGCDLYVEVTGTWDGSASSTSTSDHFTVGDPGDGGGDGGGGDTGTPPTPVIYGDGTVGSVIVVDPGTWDNYDLTFQWYSCGFPIADAIGDSYAIADSDAGCDLYVEVTGTWAGSAGSTSISDYFPIPIPGDGGGGGDGGDGGGDAGIPEVWLFGYTIVNQTLYADTSQWPADIELEYQWLLDGEPIEGANERSYVLRGEDGMHLVSVAITGAPDGVNVVTGTSEGVDVSLAEMTSTPPPVMKGVLKVGRTLSVTVGEWDESVEFTYQWYIDNDAVEGATDATFVLPAVAVDLDVYVEVTGSKVGYNPSIQASEAGTVALGTLTKTPVPVITGTLKVGQKLTAGEKTWNDDVTFEYQWFATGKAINGATKKTFTLTGAQLGKTITVKVTGSLEGYTSVTKSSVATKKIAVGVITIAAVPKIVGAVKAGKAVTVDTGVWVAGAKLAIVWLLDGKAIKGATGKKLTISKKVKGKKLSVSVTGTAVGYTALKKVSKVVKVG